MHFGWQRLNDFEAPAFFIQLDGDAVSDRQAAKLIRTADLKKYGLAQVGFYHAFARRNIDHGKDAGDHMYGRRTIRGGPGARDCITTGCKNGGKA